MHFWCRLTGGVEAQALLQQALLKGVAFAPGELFYPDGGGRYELRLCFSCVATDKIEEGVKRLRSAVPIESTRLRGENSAVPLI